MPMPEDKEMLRTALAQKVWPREAGRRLGMDPERVVEICEGWAAEGIYEYFDGVTADLGWMVEQPPSRVDKPPTRRGQ